MSTAAAVLEAEWVWAGMTAGSRGELGRDLPASAWLAPEVVVLDGATLVGRGFRMVDAQPELLSDFLGVADGSDQDVLVFAQRWGVLRDGRLDVPPLVPSERGLGTRESTDGLRMLARHYRAIINVAARVHLGQPVSWSDFEPVSEYPIWRADAFREALRSGAALPLGNDYDDKRFGQLIVRRATDAGRQPEPPEAAVAYLVSKWLEITAVTLRLSWDDTPRVEFFVGALAGALALQLATAVARQDSFAFCSTCGRGYIPKRRPRAGQNNYCQDCGIRAAWRTAQRKRKGGR